RRIGVLARNDEPRVLALGTQLQMMGEHHGFGTPAPIRGVDLRYAHANSSATRRWNSGLENSLAAIASSRRTASQASSGLVATASSIPPTEATSFLVQSKG